MPNSKRLCIFSCILISFSFFVPGPASLTIKSKYDFFTADNIGNVYTVREDELIKYLPSGKMLGRYSNLRLGNITSIDATNPLKLLIYYRDFQQIIFLDNQLSVNSDIVPLEKLGYEQTDLVCAGSNNSFWIYNKQNNELIRFNENSKKIASTGNLKQVLRAELSPNFMLEQNNFLYLNCPDNGIYVFDMFGAFSKVISIQKLRDFQVSDNIVFYKRDSSLCSYDHRTFEESCIKLDPLSIRKGVLIFGKKIYQGYTDSIKVSELPQ